MLSDLLDIRRIYVEPDAAALPRGKEVLARFPGAERVEVESHQRIPELYGDETNVRRWVRIKREALVLGVKKSLTARPNGRSADFIAPSTANGCAMACAYCYVPRRKGYSNPITVFANIDKITGYVRRHVGRQGVKPAPNECDPHAWVYDIGENSDCSLDARISDNVRDLVETFRWLPTAKASFAAGYEVHVNFSPVMVRDGWLEDWATLLDQLDAGIGPAARAQLAAEVIFLTHNEKLHEVNLGWHPKAEDVLWRPDLQQPKRSQSGAWNVRYRTGSKGRYVTALTDLITQRTPYCRIRYAF
jgi:spore photoproduct lyase